MISLSLSFTLSPALSLSLSFRLTESCALRIINTGASLLKQEATCINVGAPVTGTFSHKNRCNHTLSSWQNQNENYIFILPHVQIWFISEQFNLCHVLLHASYFPYYIPIFIREICEFASSSYTHVYYILATHCTLLTHEDWLFCKCDFLSAHFSPYILFPLLLHIFLPFTLFLFYSLFPLSLSSSTLFPSLSFSYSIPIFLPLFCCTRS